MAGTAPRSDPAEADNSGPRFLTLGALVRFAVSTKEAKVWYFITPLRVGPELPLLGADRQPLSRKDLAELITEERITDVPEKHRERVRTEVFGLTGDLGKERFDGLAKLLHTLRSPDVGNRIEEGRLPAILADALPPLSEDALTDAGQQLDGLTSTREDQRRLEAAREQVHTFLDAYRKYATGVLTTSLQTARTSADSVRAAEGEAGRLAERAQTLQARVAADRKRLGELTEQAGGLEARLQGLKESEAYHSIQELNALSAVVRSLASAADAKFDTAAEMRRTEADKVAGTGPHADEVEQRAGAVSEEIGRLRRHLVTIGLPEHDLPAQVRVDRGPGARSADLVRTSRERESEEVIRPVPDFLALVPPDLAALAETARRVETAARTRSAQALNRAEDARSLAEERRRVDRATEEATGAEARAEDENQTAVRAAEKRDDIALDLVDQWRTWIADATTIDLLGTADWSPHPVLGLLLADRTALCGDGDAIPLLDLDRAADEAVTAAADTLATDLARLAQLDATDQQRVDELTAERTRLEQAHDPDPVPPSWVTVSEGAALWRCVDFADDLSAEHRAGVEGALLASGLLTATVDRHGQLTAATGQLLVSPSGERVPGPLSTALRFDPAGPLPADAVMAVLDRIGLDDRTAGRHTVPTARHIGAAARTAARAARLAEIGTELGRLADAAESRQREREQIRGRQRALRDCQRSTPRSMELAQARTSAADAIRRAQRSAAEAGRLRIEADRLGRAWAEKDREHRRACAQFGLPVDEAALRDLHASAERAAAGCTAVVERAGLLDKAMGRFRTVVQAVPDVAKRRADAEHVAAGEWRRWHTEATKLKTLTDAVGSDGRDIERQVEMTERELERTKAAAETLSAALLGLAGEAASAATEAKAGAARVGELRNQLAGQITWVLAQLGQPGIVETAFATPPGQVLTEPAPDRVIADVEALLGSLRRGRSDENALMRAQQVFEQAISGSYDVTATIASGVRLFELVDADGRRPLAQAAIEIDRQCETGRTALTEREHQVFRKFVLGEVGEELRGRLSQAGRLIAAMNTSLKSIRTSHGIGVRLTWKLAEDASGDIIRIKELIATAAAVRSPAQDSELTDLMAARVAAEAVKDPSGGYAVHLRAALDYRSWHTVEVVITGPEEGRERRISRRAKLSQGETRFVSYVTLFAAVDAYLSGLDNTAMSLRLILLDDAFAKVDEPTIAELLGLLVRLDVDFVMTGHALWGCVPQVPALDVYEICREDGTPAATAHVRWDGRNRHFLHAT
ncbi:MAG: TIGR02680 family protein [Catenulispora sp. 13_1_20CM_3_70_7]|nr:MAG: TIGR02680 family protein [Catenulispora sp. 13_1_20CM_3_70_7]